MLRFSHLQRSLGWKLVWFLTVMASSLADRNTECSSCCILTCILTVQVLGCHASDVSISPHARGESSLVAIMPLLISHYSPFALFPLCFQSLPLWRWLRFAVYFPGRLCSLLPILCSPSRPGAPRCSACG